MPVVKALLPFLKKGDRGLDFGSGPGPILDILFKREGFTVQNYDPYFAPLDFKNSVLFDFVTCTEVFEHFYHPERELKAMKSLLKDKGYLVIMTQFRNSSLDFNNWYYRMDNTHVGFLSSNSLAWIAKSWGFEILSTQASIAVLRRRA